MKEITIGKAITPKLAPFRDIGLYFLILFYMTKTEIDMATEIHEKIHIYDKTEEPDLTIYLSSDGNIIMTDDEDIDNLYSFWISINQEDWYNIKNFIDNQLKKHS